MRGKRFFVEVPVAWYYEPQKEWLVKAPQEKWTASMGRKHFRSKRRAIRIAEYLADKFGSALAGYRVRDKHGNLTHEQIYEITKQQQPRDTSTND